MKKRIFSFLDRASVGSGGGLRNPQIHHIASLLPLLSPKDVQASPSSTDPDWGDVDSEAFRPAWHSVWKIPTDAHCSAHLDVVRSPADS